MPRDLFQDIEPKDLLAGMQEEKTTMHPEEASHNFMLDALTSFKPNFKGLPTILKEDVEQTASSPGVHALQGMQDSIMKMLSLGLLPNKPQGEGTAYGIGKGLGEVGGFLGGGELLDLARMGLGASRLANIPGVGQALRGLESSPLAKRLTGSTLFGLAENPEDRLTGAAEGLVGGATKEAIPMVAKKATELFTPHKYAEEIVNILGKGKNLSENAKEIAKDLYTKANEIKQIGKEKYDLVFNTNNLGNRGLQIRAAEKPSSLIPKDISETFDRKIDDLYSDFKDNPTLKNAHELQSQLGTTIRKLQKMDDRGTLSIADRKTMQGYEKARKIVKNNISDELSRAEEEHGVPYNQLYNEANAYHAQNVVPYRETPTISQIAKGKTKNPRNIQNIFKNPEENIQKIIEDLGPEFKNKIIYSELGKLKNNLNPEDLLKGYESLEKKGLADYLNPEISKYMDILDKKVQKRNFARNALGAVGGALLGGMSPIPYAKEIGGIGGYLAAPGIEKLITRLAGKKGI